VSQTARVLDAAAELEEAAPEPPPTAVDSAAAGTPDADDVAVTEPAEGETAERPPEDIGGQPS
jgi:hypothetical protein